MRLGLWFAAAACFILGLAMPAKAQLDALIYPSGGGNSPSFNWVAGNWQLRGVLLDSLGEPVGDLSVGFTFNASGNNYPVNVQVHMVGNATPSDKIRVFRKTTPILPADEGVEYADFPCGDGLGGLLPLCDPATQTYIDGAFGRLFESDFVGVAAVPSGLSAGISEFTLGGAANQNTERWAAGAWNVRALLLDGENAVGELHPGFEFVASGTNRPVDVRVALASRGYLADRIRVYRKQGVLLPGDQDVEYAEFTCDGGSGEISQLCQAQLLQPIDLNLGRLDDSDFVGLGAVPPSERNIGPIGLALAGSGNIPGRNWPAGTWYVRTMVLDRERGPASSLSTEVVRVLGGSVYPSGSIDLDADAAVSDRIRIFRSNAPINPGDANVEYADFWCADASGGVLSQCLAGSSSLSFSELGNGLFGRYTQVPSDVPVAAPPSTGVSVLNPTVSSYPNPAGERVNIRYAMARQGRAELRVYDLAGRLVRELSTGSADASEHEVVWDGRGNDGRRVSAGVYLIRVSTPYGEATAKTLLLK